MVPVGTIGTKSTCILQNLAVLQPWYRQHRKAPIICLAVLDKVECLVRSHYHWSDVGKDSTKGSCILLLSVVQVLLPVGVETAASYH